MKLNTAGAANRLQFDGKKRPFFEIYYLKVVDPGQKMALWARYTLLSPASKSSLPTATLWGIFQAPGATPIALKKTLPLHEVDIFHKDFFIQIQDNYLSLDGARGHIGDSDHLIRWDLQFEDPNTLFALYPCRAMYSKMSPVTKFIEPRAHTFVTGSVHADQRAFHFTHHPAHQAHLWGKGYVHSWAWAHCNMFREDPDCWMEVLSARVKIGPLSAPALKLAGIFYEDRLYQITNPLHWLKCPSQLGWAEWVIEVSFDLIRFVIRIHRDPADIFGVEYEGPRGEERTCYTSLQSHTEMKVYKRRPKKPWHLVKELTSQGTTSFETVETEARQQIPILV